MSTFSSYAHYYDLLYADKSYGDEAKFVDECIRAYTPKAHTILELGCGTGGHAFELAKRGWTIHGVDLSGDMLDRARQRLTNAEVEYASRLSFSQGDVRDVRLGKRVDAVVSLFHVMSYQVSNDDLRLAFETAKTHLRPGGLFVFDCWYGPAVLTDRPVVRIKRLEDHQVSIVRLAEPVMHANDNVVDVQYQVLVKDKSTGVMEEFRETHRMRYLFQPEVAAFLQHAGFEYLECGEWLTQRKPGFSTWNVYFVARA